MKSPYSYIVNPETGRRVTLNGKIGQRVIKNYLDTGFKIFISLLNVIIKT